MLGAQMLGDTRGGLDGMALQAFHRCIGRLLVEVAQNHRASDRRGLLLSFGASQTSQTRRSSVTRSVQGGLDGRRRS